MRGHAFLSLIVSLFVALGCAQRAAALTTNIPSSQRNALVQIYNALNGSNWPSGSQWNNNSDLCSSWYAQSSLPLLTFHVRRPNDD
jgi:hypothetical protein